MDKVDPNAKLSLRQLRRQGKETAMLFLPLAAIFALLFFLLQLMLPQTLAVGQALEQLHDDKNAVAKLEQKWQILQEFNKEQLLSLLEKSQIIMPANSDFPFFLLYLKELEQKSGVELVNLDIQGAGPLPDASVQGLKLFVKLKGSQEGVFSFFRALNDPVERKLTVKDIAVKQTGENNEAELNIVAFYSPFIKAIGSVEQALPPLSPLQQRLVEQIAQLTVQKTVQAKTDTETNPPPLTPRANPFAF